MTLQRGQNLGRRYWGVAGGSHRGDRFHNAGRLAQVCFAADPHFSFQCTITLMVYLEAIDFTMLC